MAEVVLEKPKTKSKIAKATQGPEYIIYRLIKQNDVKQREDTPLYQPYISFPNKDIIVWEYKNEDGTTTQGTRAIRWLPGESSIFVDEQEKNGRKIPDTVLQNRAHYFEIINGDIKVAPHEKTKIDFLDMCNFNEESPYRTGEKIALFKRYSEEKLVEERSQKQTKQQEAMQKAFSADESQVAFHADYLAISTIDRNTNAPRRYTAIVADYRQVAIDDPDRFLRTFDDPDLKLKYRIKRAIEENYINTSFIPGKAIIYASKEEICDIPPTNDQKQIVDTLFLFSQTTKGASFLKKIGDFDI